MQTPWGWWSSIVVIGVCVAVGAHAQSILSPGPLSAPHQQLEGLENCLKCHEGGQQVSMGHCMNCHDNIKKDLAQHNGFHGHLAANQRTCERCHHEHLGLEHSLLPWKGDRSDFDHTSTGYPLVGAHAKVGCKDCHDPRLIKDPKVLKQVHEHPKQLQYGGLSTRCESCHFDEHRGQEKKACSSCHTEKSWKVTLFKHRDSDYPLTGKHTEVTCAGCHPHTLDTKTAVNVFPAPMSRMFERFTPLAHALCTDCHRDPHDGEFGPRCSSCHTTAGWKVMVRTAADTGFHDKTRYPLRGAHNNVDCRACHGPFPNKPAVFKNMAFEQCKDCHADAHEHQLDGDCKNCHRVQGFLPPTYTTEEHDKSIFPLREAHAVVACNQCHETDPALDKRIPAQLRANLRRDGRAELFSLASFETKQDLGRCDTCHLSPHAGQFAARVQKSGCTDCHREDSFHKVRFDHELESRFPLTGAHARTACVDCHVPVVTADSPDPVVLYTPMNKQCSACHADVHSGQFLTRDGRNSCETCHNTEHFKPALFNHNDPNFSHFPLEGAHQPVACTKCHPTVKVGDHEVARYRPTPAECNDCHADYHEGAFASLAESLGAPANTASPCSGCHTVQSWLPASFGPHDKTGFPLQGAHRSVTCVDCHLRSFSRAIPQSCSGCHQDAHGGELGTQCSECHSQDDWQAEMSIEAHRRFNFPLRGAHGALPCVECHPAANAHDYRGLGATCFGCHSADYALANATSVNHTASGFAVTCRDCHDPWNFSHARMNQHDQCFLINGGPHAAIPCLTCHTSLTGTVANTACNTGTASCTSCHVHNAGVSAGQHVNVEGYAYQNQKCYECHKFTVSP